MTFLRMLLVLLLLPNEARRSLREQGVEKVTVTSTHEAVTGLGPLRESTPHTAKAPKICRGLAHSGQKWYLPAKYGYLDNGER
jgi:hypothetical protein